MRAVGRRASYGLGVLLAFAVGSVGAFLLFEWPPLLKEIVLAYLMVFLIIRLVLVLGRFLLAPGAERFRVIPMATPSARFWFVWSAILVGWFAFVRMTLDVLALLGVSRPAGYLIGLLCGVVLVGLSLYVVWRHPERESGERTSRGHRVGAWLLSLYVIVVWLLAFTGSPTPFYVGIILLLLPIAIRSANLAVKHVLRPADSEADDVAVPSLATVTVERGLRAALLIGGAYLIAWFLGLDLAAMTMSDTMATRFLRGAINAVVILLLADFAWHLARAWIDCRLAEADAGGTAEADEIRRRARLRTLLPILRNALLVVLVVMAVLMALAALGVQIGPLIAGAGVVGVAIGFGAQTLVKDIISGMFYLLDDAFRVGEYIVSGSYKGTVESFSLRSIKLRHHRGYLYTVPFGELGAIQNMSRDWVIDKMSVSVTYDTDLDKAKRIIKQVGKQMHGRPGVRAAHHRDPEDAGRRAVRRLRDPAPHQDDDQARRAVRDPAPRLCHDQEGIRRQRHRVRPADRHGGGWRRGARRGRPEGAGAGPAAQAGGRRLSPSVLVPSNPSASCRRSRATCAQQVWVKDEILFGEVSRTAAVDGKAVALAPPDWQAVKRRRRLPHEADRRLGHGLHRPIAQPSVYRLGQAAAEPLGASRVCERQSDPAEEAILAPVQLDLSLVG